MIYIDINKPNIIRARDYHYQIMKYIIQKRIKGNNFKDKPPITNMKIQQIKGIDYAIQIFFENEENLKKVLIGLPTELDKIKTKFSKKGKIKQLFHYDNWIKYDKYNAYHLAEKLDIPTCPYCGRMYTKTVISEKGKKIVRPDFDHWFPKSKYPLLALSFYNLIPSCNICNSRLKGAYDFELDTHFHPYHKEEGFKYTFSYDLDAYEKPRVKIVTENDFSKDSVKAFELEEIYKTHQDEVEDLLKIRQAYSEKYIEILNNFSGINLSKEEVYRLAFGAHLAEDKFDRRPLSKMKKDILTELGIVKLK
ncbi:HNH endonuclease [Capnocytophaga canis]|uniref:HNH endonuclease n=1 Tax=Capnocytophaga canis TaxID=1848903 RepID=UPI00385E7862